MRIKVKTIRRHGQSVLVEWADADGLRRATIPMTEIVNDAVDSVSLEHGIPYGIPWETCPLPEVTPAMIAHELRNRGIWTLSDLEAEPMKAIAALQAAYAFGRAALTTAALEFNRRD